MMTMSIGPLDAHEHCYTAGICHVQRYMQMHMCTCTPKYNGNLGNNFQRDA